MPYTTTPPEIIDYTTPAIPSATAPGHTAPSSPSNSAPGHTTPEAPTGTAPGHTTPAAPSAIAPDDVSIADYTPTTYPAGTGVDVTSPTPLLVMPATFSPAFVELTGSAAALDHLTVAPHDVGRIIQGTVATELKSYQVRAGTDAPALPGLVRPANYHAGTNAFVFVQL
jgi:hypothetical protein